MKTELSGLVPTAAAGDGEKGYFAIDIAFAFEGAERVEHGLSEEGGSEEGRR